MRRIRVLFVIIIIGLVGTGLYFQHSPPSEQSSSTPTIVPVVTQTVERRDVPVLLRALGHVRPLSNIEVRPQVEGLLVSLPVREGQRVRKGDLLAQIDDRAIRANVRQVEAERDVTRAELDIARTDLRRYQGLVRDHAAPAQTLDQQKALVAQLEATLDLREAAVAAAKVQLSYTRLYSPIEGRVGIRNTFEGSLVRASDTTSLFSIVQTNPISIEASLPQSRLPDLQRMLAQKNEAPVRAYYEDGGALIAEGKLSLIDNRVDESTGTLRVKALFANGDEHLWPDQSVVVAFQSQLLKDALVITSQAIRQGAEGTYVWRVEHGKATPVTVKLIHDADGLAVVEGLQVGDQVVVDGQSRLRPGTEVKSTQGTEPVEGNRS
ncbi:MULTISPECIES: efflux RND transporter periplasmic adaptor subunit [unclassified Pseudomonas]|uniref:efflux RND transporter periplasmic adaptor subunit n=1 Tax=Pseudomonas TaxID=286 RepID=UPI00257E77F9|nr:MULTISPECIES: efflux RND transporter periplasmic adaptor subunit [unclassified Pseudomonas]